MSVVLLPFEGLFHANIGQLLWLVVQLNDKLNICPVLRVE